MVKVNQPVYYCDLCEGPTGSFHYYEVTTSALGVIEESSLMIDLCESCARKVQGHIPKALMRDRYEPGKELPENIDELMKDLQKAKETAEHHQLRREGF